MCCRTDDLRRLRAEGVSGPWRWQCGRRPEHGTVLPHVDKEAVELGRDEGEDGLLDDFVLDGEESEFAFLGVFLGYLDVEVGLGSPRTLSQFGDDGGEVFADILVVLGDGNPVKPAGGVFAHDELPRRQQGLLLTETVEKATCRHGGFSFRQVVRTRHWSWLRCRRW